MDAYKYEHAEEISIFEILGFVLSGQVCPTGVLRICVYELCVCDVRLQDSVMLLSLRVFGECALNQSRSHRIVNTSETMH